MKIYYKYLWMAGLALCLLGACSPENDDIPEPEPKPDTDKTEQNDGLKSTGNGIDDMKNKKW